MPFTVKMQGSLEAYLASRNIPAADIDAAATQIRESNNLDDSTRIRAGDVLVIPDQIEFTRGRDKIRLVVGDTPAPVSGCGMIDVMDADTLDRLSFTRLALATGRGSHAPVGCGSYEPTPAPSGCGSYDAPVGCGSYSSSPAVSGCGSMAAHVPIGGRSSRSAHTPVGCGVPVAAYAPSGCGGASVTDAPSGCGVSPARDAPSGCGVAPSRRPYTGC